jgi:hypothetical protein
MFLEINVLQTISRKKRLISLLEEWGILPGQGENVNMGQHQICNGNP